MKRSAITFGKQHWRHLAVAKKGAHVIYFFQLQIHVFHFRPVTYKVDIKGFYVENKSILAPKLIMLNDLVGEANHLYVLAKNHMTIFHYDFTFQYCM